MIKMMRERKWEWERIIKRKAEKVRNKKKTCFRNEIVAVRKDVSLFVRQKKERKHKL